MIYAVTGSTGSFGAQAVDHLLRKGVAPASVVALARNQAKAAGLTAKGVTVRLADYTDKAALVAALQGVDRLLLVSGSEPGQRLAQHQNVLDAARQAGVKRVVYTSITQATTSTNLLAGEHRDTEAAIKQSGLEYVFVRNNWYIENYAGDLAGAKHSGVIAAAITKGKVGSALRSEYAEAAVAALVGAEHAGQTYELAGPLWSYQDLAAAVTKVVGRPVQFVTVSVADKTATLVTIGLPAGVAEFYATLDLSIEAGTLDYASNDLAKLLGRQPTDLVGQIRSILG